MNGTPETTPPSFIPSGAPRRRSAPSQTSAQPQSFQPRRSAPKRADSPAAEAAVPPSFSPVATSRRTEPRSSSGSGNRMADRSQETAVGDESTPFISRRENGFRSFTPEPHRPSDRGFGERHGNDARSMRRTVRPQPRGIGHGRTRAIGAHRIRHRALTVLAALLVVILVAMIGLVNWVNGQLTHKDMLSSMANTPASTWLILGSDERDGTAGTGTEQDVPGSRTDSILVLTRPKSGSSSLISIPRDSYVTVDGQDMKINAVATMSGYKALVEQVESITGMKIDHVVQIGFGGVEKVVDAIGGVELCYDSTVNDANSGLVWEAGCHQADGGTALAFSRMRYSDPTGDIGRAARQRQVIAAVAKKASSPAVLTNPATVSKLMKAGLSSLTVDEKTGAFDLIGMALAFKAATGTKGVTGSVYYTNTDYYPKSGIGSTVLLNESKNTELFSQLEDGTHDPGTVGGM